LSRIMESTWSGFFLEGFLEKVTSQLRSEGRIA
jgi:hypothetical protein